LTQGKSAVVDDADFEWLSQWKWQAQKVRRTWYAVRTFWKDGKCQTVLMHKEILHSRGQVDHRDRDGLNNRRGNLRGATHSQQQANSRKREGCTSPFKGVTWDAARGKWRAQIKVFGKGRIIGRFATEEEAAMAYDSAALEQFGEFANPNFWERSA